MGEKRECDVIENRGENVRSEGIGERKWSVGSFGNGGKERKCDVKENVVREGSVRS